MTQPVKYELESEVIDINNVPHLKISYIKEKTDDKGVVTYHSEGYEIYGAGPAAQVLEGEIARTDQMEDGKTQRVVLSTQDRMWMKSQQRVMKYNDYKKKMQQSGLAFDDHLKAEQETIAKQKEVRDFWREALAKITRVIKDRGLDKTPEAPEEAKGSEAPAETAKEEPKAEEAPKEEPKEAENADQQSPETKKTD